MHPCAGLCDAGEALRPRQRDPRARAAVLGHRRVHLTVQALMSEVRAFTFLWFAPFDR